jgi:hypothetical protein
MYRIRRSTFSVVGIEATEVRGGDVGVGLSDDSSSIPFLVSGVEELLG